MRLKSSGICQIIPKYVEDEELWGNLTKFFEKFQNLKKKFFLEISKFFFFKFRNFSKNLVKFTQNSSTYLGRFRKILGVLADLNCIPKPRFFCVWMYAYQYLHLWSTKISSIVTGHLRRGNILEIVDNFQNTNW